MENDKKDYQFMNNYPIITQEYIVKAIEIYDYLHDKSLKIRTKKVFQKEYLSANDLRVLSLFLAGLIIDSEIKSTMQKNEITKETVEKFLNIEIPNTNHLEDKDYEEYYNLFKPLLSDLFRGYSTYPEVLFNNLFYSSITNSKILFAFYFFLGKDYYNDISRYSIDNIRKKERDKRIDNLFSASNNDEKEKNSPSRSYLEKYGHFITDDKYVINPAIGREKEIQKLIITLLTRSMSPLLLGEPGVGKTAIVEGLAYAIQNNLVPEDLQNKKIVSIDMNTLLAGTCYRGDFEKKIDKIIKEIENNPNIILYIDEFHSVIGAGSSSNSNLDFANILKPYLSRGQIKIIGATTNYEYAKYIEEDKAFHDRFQCIEVKEPSFPNLLKIVYETIAKFKIEMGIDFLDDKNTADKVINLLISATDKKQRSYKNSLNNPRLIIMILEYIYACSKSNNHNVVTLDDILEGIEISDFINRSMKEYLLLSLKKLFIEEKSEANGKILLFPSRLTINYKKD